MLRQPNRYQTVVKFVEQWITSKLTAGNAYVLKERDARGVVSALYVLDPLRVTPLIAPDGVGLLRLETRRPDRRPDGPMPSDVVVPAREIIHDPMVTLFHPLVGVTPLYACGLAAQQGLTMQTGSEQFFRLGVASRRRADRAGRDRRGAGRRASRPTGKTNFSGANVGRVAVLGKGLKYEAMTVNAADTQLIEQLNWTAHQRLHVLPRPARAARPAAIAERQRPRSAAARSTTRSAFSRCWRTSKRRSMPGSS